MKKIYLLITIILTILISTGCTQTFDINVEYDSNMGNVKGLGTYEENNNVILDAKPNDNYKFVGWYENDKLIDDTNKLEFNATNNRDLEARFEIKSYSITIDKNIEDGGKVIINGEKTHGSKIKIKAEVNDGFEFIGYKENGREITKNSEFSFTIEKDKSIRAEFEQIYPRLDIEVIGNGNTNYDSGYYDPSQPLNLRATPEEGSYFIGWIGDKYCTISKDKKYTLTLEKDTKIRAEFDNYDKNNYSEILLSEDKKHLVRTKNGYIQVKGTENFNEVLGIKLEQNQKVSKIEWVDNSTFIYFSNGEVVLQNINGDNNILHNDFNYSGSVRSVYSVANNISNAYTSYSETWSFPNGNVSVNVYKEGKYLSNFDVEYGRDGPSYGAPLASNNIKYIAMRGLNNLFIYNLNSNDISKTGFDYEPIAWRDNSNLLAFYALPLYSGCTEPLILSSYDLSLEKMTNVLYIPQGDISYFLDARNLSPNKKNLVYEKYSDRVRGKKEIFYLEINYDSIIDIDKDRIFDYVDMDKKYATTQTKLLDGSLKNLCWLDNIRVVFNTNSDDTYIFDGSDLLKLPIESNHLVGFVDNNLIYTDSKESLLKKFDLTRIKE